MADRLAGHPDIAAVGVAGPGFINITLTDTAIARIASRGFRGPLSRFPVTDEPENVVVDYAGPNVAKAMHVGHLRATIIGDSLARLFSFAGHKVIRDPHFGDWGFQMGLLIAAIADEQPELPYFDPGAGTYPSESPVTLDDLQRIYPEASGSGRSDDDFADDARRATVRLQQGDPGSRPLASHEIGVRGVPAPGLRRPGSHLRPVVRGIRRARQARAAGDLLARV